MEDLYGGRFGRAGASDGGIRRCDQSDSVGMRLRLVETNSTVRSRTLQRKM